MIVYHIGHFGALSKALLIHFNYHKNERCIFLVDTILCNPETIKFLEEFTLKVKDFSDVILYSDAIFKNSKSIKELKNNISDFFSNLLLENSIDLSSVDKIYTMFDTFNAFAAYCLLNNIPLIFVDVFGMLNKNRYRLNGEHWKYYDALLENLGALGYDCKAKNCSILIKDSSISSLERNKINFAYLQNSLSLAEKEKVLELYGFNQNKANTELCNLLVFSSGWILTDKKISREEYFYFYQLLCDFFCGFGEKILLKPHPNMTFTQEEANNYFDNSLVLPNYFPSEFIPFIKNLQIKQILATSSSGIPNGIYGCRSFIAFEIFYEISVFKRLYFALQLERFLQPIYNKYYHYGLHNKFVWGMQDNVFSKSNLRSEWASLKDFEPNSVTIIDNYLWNGEKYRDVLIDSLRNLNNNAVIIFLDSKDAQNYIFDEYKEGLAYVKTINFVGDSQKIRSDNQIEKIHVFCKDINIYKLLSTFNYREYMPYSKTLYCSC